MTEEQAIKAQEVDESPHGETETDVTDWKAEARKWERYAKKAQAAEKELEALKQSQMTEQEKEKARADAAEKELAEFKAEKERSDAAHRISKETGVPLDLLFYCSDEQAMNDFAKKYADETHVGSAPTALNGKRIIRGNDQPKTNSEVFADFAQNLFK